MRVEPGGGLPVAMKAGYNFHFWSAGGRVSIDPTDIAGVWVAIEARLIGESPVMAPDPEARLMLSAGADYWESLTAEWDQWTTNGDIGIGRFRFLSSEWQAFHMHSLTEAQLEANPPPFP
ncbi:MAG: hypothetical protein D6722_01935 [Bacteroidetes bacterium]|nr:MAG: hypothetical protein D6722_01935 [Bacteroidota bacterium]